MNTKEIIKSILIIALCVAGIISLCNRNKIFGNSNNITTNALLGVIGVSLAILCIYTIYISSNKIFDIVENKIQKNKANDIVEFEICEVKSIINRCDIVDIVGLCDTKEVNFGTSAESYADSELFNKQYYINNIWYNSEEEFYKNLFDIFKSDHIMLISIDNQNPILFK